MVERVLAKDEVAGSSPVSRSIIKSYYDYIFIIVKVEDSVTV